MPRRINFYKYIYIYIIFIFLLQKTNSLENRWMDIITLLINRQMRTVTNLFILNLAVSDLLVGVFCIPTTLVDNLITEQISLITALNPRPVCSYPLHYDGLCINPTVLNLVLILMQH
uniref:G-protein coupled receptors family 1 profile domain-containing protein n=1 Tax=Sinocyclocheilus rhinocerous TaxID=307959 RepID=A0A673MXA5_9TELE